MWLGAFKTVGEKERGNLKDMSDDVGGVCIVTQPERAQTGKAHVHDLADIIAEITSVAILTANVPPESVLDEEYEVVEFSSRGAGQQVLVEAFRFALNQLRLCLILRKREESTVLFFGASSYLLSVVFARLSGKTVVVLPRGDVPLSLRLRWEQSLPSSLARFLAWIVLLLERATYRSAHALVTYTPSMARQLGLERYGEKLHTNGARFVDTEQFDVQVPFEERSRMVGFIGRLDVEKRIPELAAAAKQLPDDVRFVFVGDGEYRERLESELEAEINRGSVEVVGWVDRNEVPEQLNRLRLLVVPSHPTEGLPTAILEAMACGTPVYATPVSGVPDVVLEGETGFLMDEVDAGMIAGDIEEIMRCDSLAIYSKNCRNSIEREYSFEGAVERYKAIFGKVT